MIRFTLNGQEVTAGEGETILSACRHEGIDTPTLCFGDTLAPKGACRVCVVELDGSRPLVPACSRVVEPGMVVRTGTERVKHARRMVLEFLGLSVDMSSTPGYQSMCATYDADPGRFASGPHATNAERGPIIDNELYAREYGKCILCYKCVDACGEQWQNTFAIAVAGRGFASRIAVEFDGLLTDSACVYCGNCLAVCPTGALTPMTEFAMRRSGTWAPDRQSTTTTVCPYCGVGCNLTLHVQDNEIVSVSSPSDHSVSHGNLCVKGRFGFTHVHIR